QPFVDAKDRVRGFQLRGRPRHVSGGPVGEARLCPPKKGPTARQLQVAYDQQDRQLHPIGRKVARRAWMSEFKHCDCGHSPVRPQRLLTSRSTMPKRPSTTMPMIRMTTMVASNPAASENSRAN